MQDVRCINCNKLLCKAEQPYKLELKCPKCKQLQTQYKSEILDFTKTIECAKVYFDIQGESTNKGECQE